MGDAGRLTRFLCDDVCVRVDARIVSGLLVPYGVPVPVGEFTETFRRGVFARSIAQRGSRIRLFAEAEQRTVVGKATALRETREGLAAEFLVGRSPLGDDVLDRLAQADPSTCLAVNVRPVRGEWTADRSAVIRVEAALLDVCVQLVSSDLRSGTEHRPLSVVAARERLHDLLVRT